MDNAEALEILTRYNAWPNPAGAGMHRCTHIKNRSDEAEPRRRGDAPVDES